MIALSFLAIFTSLIFIKLAPSDLLLNPDPLPALALYFGSTFIYSILGLTGLVLYSDSTNYDISMYCSTSIIYFHTQKVSIV